MDNQYKFHKLTPSDDVEMGIYERAMEYIFSNDDIRNIAISGTYGAGKSSMIESYKKAYPEKKFIHISLAHFVQEQGEEGNENDIKEKQVAVLEGKIINQLVHQIDSQKIPQTNFRIKNNVDDKHILTAALFATIFVAITCFLWFKSTWENMIKGFSIACLRQLFYFTTTNEMEFIMGAAALVILGIAIYKIIKLQKNAKLFKKLNVQGNEIEIFDESKDSYFDKYLNEVLYIFEHADVDGIIFEDIDRYDTNIIFEKLREVNYLLNQRNRIHDRKEQRQIMRFFYLLRDDIFESKDRTKFFDFILPIVPVVDASNTYDKFIDYFRDANLLGLFDMDFVQGLSLYVDDMRILKNICNEFVIYHERLKTSFTEQSNNKLLAMIVYKNLFPKDFGYLQTGRGYVHTLFSEKKNFVCPQINQLQKNIDELQEKNIQLNSERCDDLDELNALYFLIDGLISVDGKKETEYKSRKDFVKAILVSENVKRYSYRYGWEVINIEKELTDMEQNTDYEKRKLLIERKRCAEIYKNNMQIVRLKKQIEELAHAYLKDIITRENETAIFQSNYINAINEVEEFEDVKRSPYFDLIKFLIRDGYLDETYPDYMTYFYENSITANDKTFLRSITDRHAKPFDYKLDNAALVISRMRMIDFKSQEALNFELVDQLLSETEKNKERLKYFLDAIRNSDENKRIENFVSALLERDIAREKFVYELNKSGNDACDWILSTKDLTLQNKRQYVKDMLCVSSEETITLNNSNEKVTQFINHDSDFLEILDTDVVMVKKGFEILGVKFADINFATANRDLLLFVYNNNMYELNIDMIQKVLKYFYHTREQDNILLKNLSFILSREDQPLYGYVKENLDSYIEELISATQETEDDEEVVLYILNCSEDKITEKHKKAYIASTRTAISKLDEVDDPIWWEELLEQDKVQKTMENLCDYYFKSGNEMDDRLIQFINCFEESPVLEPTNINSKYEKYVKDEENANDKLFEDIIKSNEIKNDIYEELLCAFNKQYEEFNETELEPEKIEILINRDILEMNTYNLKTMRQHYSELCILFILKNIEKYLEIMNKNIFSFPELMQILEEKIDDELKIRLLKFNIMPISIKNKNYSDRIQDYIVENLYSNKDFQHLVKWYPSNRIKLRKRILDIAIEIIQNGEEISCVFHNKLLESILLSDKIDIVDKQILLARQIELGIQKSVAKTAFGQLDLPEYNQLLAGGQAKVEATNTGKLLLDALKERNWIANYAKDEEDPEMFQAYGKTVKKKSFANN